MPKGIYVRTKEFLRKSSMMMSRTAKEHPAWKGEERTMGEGYIEVYAPNHPHTKSNNHILKHRLVMEKHIGRYLKPDEVVHHINGIPDDNRIENLELFENQNGHVRYHNLKGGLKK